MVAHTAGWTRRVAVASVALVMSMTAGASARATIGPLFLTNQPAMLEPAAPGVTVRPIMTVGERLRNGYRFDSLPDGIAIDPRSDGAFDVYVNHETSTVPFPYVPSAPTASNSFNDFTNAKLSHLILGAAGGRPNVLFGSTPIPSGANYQRFCSNFLVGADQGFERPLLFTNEETSDFVNRTGRAWPPSIDEAEQAGVVVAYDPATGEYRSIYGMGRHNHENSVAIPGYAHPVVLSGDDTFAAPSSQLYMYRAEDAKAVWNDQGRLWAFKSDDPVVNDYGDLSGGESVSGRFIPVFDAVARGDQASLEAWSNQNGVFQFIRVEDIAYDRNLPNVVYFADTGEPRAIPDPETGRLKRGPSGTMGPYPNGRVFKMVLDPVDPAVVQSLSILIDGDAAGAAGAGDKRYIHQPDNLETTAQALLIQEDPGSQNQYAADDPNGTTARIWRYRFADVSLRPVARVDQSADPAANQGAWESSGIVDASMAFGPGAFLVDVQAHSLWIETAPGPDLVAPDGPDWTYKREGGQLLLIRIRGT